MSTFLSIQRAAFACLAVGLISASSSALAQAPTVQLGAPPVVFRDEFTRISGLRELRDGTVLVADGAEKVLKHLDPQTQRTEVVGSVGDGPGEYHDLFYGLFARAGDTTVIFDGNAHRLVFLAGAQMAGKVQRVLASQWLLGADTLGHYLVRMTRRSLLPEPGGTPAQVDSAVLGVAPADLTRVDTLGRVRVGSTVVVRTVGGGTIERNPLDAGAQAVLFPDGWVATLYPEPYHVEWKAPGASAATSFALPFTPVPVDDAERAVVLDRDMHERGSSAPMRPAMQGVWPAVVPPFAGSNTVFPPVMGAMDGTLVIPRTVTAASTERRYDIVDRKGAVVATLLMPWEQKIVGFGPGSVYTVITGSDGLQHLQRHRWPAGQ